MNMSRDRLIMGLPRCLAVLLLYAAAAPAGEPAVSPEFPPLSESRVVEHHVGKVIWTELVTPNLAASQAFYSGLFGWTFREMRAGESDYGIAEANGRSIGGVVQRAIAPGEHKQSNWLTFIAVRDTDAAKHEVVARGGKVLAEPTTYRGRGRQAVFSDPDGAVFAVIASSSGDSRDFLAAPGEWIWSSLLAQDPKGSAKFYKRVFGYDVFDLPSDDGFEHVVLSTEGYARAGIHSLPADSVRRHSHWINFVRVIDAAQAASKATALGGRVLVEPHVDRHGGRVALLADPNGARFGVMEWTAADSKAEPK
jgi:predicted enzyme related to lactoylglutathione lyase